MRRLERRTSPVYTISHSKSQSKSDICFDSQTENMTKFVHVTKIIIWKTQGVQYFILNKGSLNCFIAEMQVFFRTSFKRVLFFL